MFDYLRDPEAIRRRSLELILDEVELSGLPDALRPLAVRLVHASGMPEVLADLAWSGDPVGAGRGALAAGAPILCDSRMVAEGIMAGRLPAANAVRCALADAGVAEDAARLGITRSAAAVDRWRAQLGGAVVAIGNAPTALYRLLELLLEEEASAPAAILAFPVGFVGAAESKAALAAARLAVPWVTVHGRRGGSALAAAAINALAADGVGAG